MTNTEFTSNRDNFCYRHPGRQSFVLCQRCLRTICPECQTQAAVGVICPECLKEQKQNRTPAQKKADRRWKGGRSILAPATGKPVVTYAIIAVTAFVGLLQMIPGFGGQVQTALAFWAPYLYPNLNGGVFEPWRVVTAALVHGSIWHFAFNMLALWVIGRTLEPMLGRWRFLTLYVLGAIGGSVAVACLEPAVSTIGASGAVFGLFGALIIIGRHMGANITGILVIIGLNLVIGFVVPGIAWQAHIGGAAVGLLVALIITRTRRRDQRLWQILWLVALGLALIALLAFVPPAVMLA
ncbi:rhomboid family intramembrane serine protease [Microbacterium sp. NPDC056234]|uniref:rhomboid family intramembrane serine protease n=1 Tax=Microbacterium sp. NPDC056234 TaxID=3345757 RepID=UPI0035DA34BF